MTYPHRNGTLSLPAVERSGYVKTDMIRCPHVNVDIMTKKEVTEKVILDPNFSPLNEHDTDREDDEDSSKKSHGPKQPPL